jgi:hypothetical protein
MPKSGSPISPCFHRIMPYPSSRTTMTVRSSPSLMAVSSSCEFIMNPPSPQMATTLRPGCTSLAAIADGSPAPIVASALSRSSVLGLRQR